MLMIVIVLAAIVLVVAVAKMFLRFALIVGGIILSGLLVIHLGDGIESLLGQSNFAKAISILVPAVIISFAIDIMFSKEKK